MRRAPGWLVWAAVSFVLLGLLPTDASADDHEPYRCNYARVRTEGSPLKVWTKPRGHGEQVDRLANGAVVYTCDENGYWYEVAYGRPGESCSLVREEGWLTDKAKLCRKGWVSRNWIDVISG